MQKIFEKLDKTILFFVLYTIIFFIFFKTLSYTIPFVLAFMFAVLLRRPTRLLMKNFKLSSALASIITTVVFYFIFFLLLILLVTSLISEIVALSKNISIYINSQNISLTETFEQLQKYYNDLDPTIINAIESNFSNITTQAGKMVTGVVNWAVTFVTSILSSIPYLVMLFIFTLISTYFFTKDISASHNTEFLSSHFTKNATKVLYVFNESKKMIFNYLKSYLVVISITFGITLIGFLVLGVDYAFVLSLLCGILDLLPILGMPMVYLPLIFMYGFVQHNYFIAIGLTILYILVFIVRQVVEPKIVSSSLGIHPVAVLAAFFIGLKAGGIMGMMFCIFLVVFYNILKKVEVI
jgi:sporulation integral membrane protein YtvI